MNKSTFALFFGNRGFFPASLIASARDPVPDNFFGVAGVAEIRNLQDVLLHVGTNGHRHHVSVTPGRVQAPLREALGHYLNFEVSLPQN